MNFDITIVGSGLVGASLGCALQNQNLKVALLDHSPLPKHSSSDPLEARALALSDTSVQCLETLKIWPKISAHASAIQSIQISKQKHFGVSTLCAKDAQISALGYVISAALLEQALIQTLETLANISVFRPDEILDLERKENIWLIRLKSQKILRTKLLVAADGAESYLRKHQGIGIKIQDHQETAMVFNVVLTQAHQNIAYKRFTRDGSIALLPFGKNQMKCVWIVPSAKIHGFENLSETEFLEKWQATFGYRLGRLTQWGKRFSYPLKSMYAENIYGDRLVLIGNAANTVHPTAAQGFNLGLRDAAMLAEIIMEAQKAHQDIGSIDVLRRYANARSRDHQNIRQLTDRLRESSLLQHLGILASEWVLPFKHLILEQGLGKNEILPKLCRGLLL